MSMVGVSHIWRSYPACLHKTTHYLLRLLLKIILTFKSTFMSSDLHHTSPSSSTSSSSSSPSWLGGVKEYRPVLNLPWKSSSISTTQHYCTTLPHFATLPLCSCTNTLPRKPGIGHWNIFSSVWFSNISALEIQQTITGLCFQPWRTVKKLFWLMLMLYWCWY